MVLQVGITVKYISIEKKRNLTDIVTLFISKVEIHADIIYSIFDFYIIKCIDIDLHCRRRMIIDLAPMSNDFCRFAIFANHHKKTKTRCNEYTYLMYRLSVGTVFVLCICVFGCGGGWGGGC